MKAIMIIALFLVQGTLAAAQQQTPPCSSQEYRQFDFWLGEWEVFNRQGQKVGDNTITKILGGCALQEEWQSASGNRGNSFNIYDRSQTRWHQTWVDNSGLLLLLDGAWIDGSMVLSGVTKGAQGETLNRITWTPSEDEQGQKQVRQLWEVSSDRGENWKVVFDGLYLPKSKAQ